MPVDGEPGRDADESETGRSRQRFRRIFVLKGLLAIAVIWIAGDWIYSRVIAARIAAWDAGVVRDSNGIQQGAESRTYPGGPVGIVLVHGFNNTPQAFSKMVPVLREAGLTVRLLRLPGFGVHPSESESVTWDQWRDEVIAGCRSLRQTCPHVLAAGHSLGGAVVIAAILHDPQCADALLLLAPAIDVSSRRSPLLPTRFWHAIGRHLFLFTRVYESPFDPNDARDPAERNPPGKPRFSSRAVVHQTMRLMDANAGRAREIRVPVLMALTRDDRVVDWVAAEKYFGALGSGYRELSFHDSSGHALNVDYDWREVADRMIAFARKVTTP